jgi:glutamate mutase epsilon subunit
MKIETIHVYLPEEAVDCWFPVRAEHIRDDLYRILDPVWEFGKGDIVRCRIQKLGAGVTFEDCLVAFEKSN